MKDTRRRCEIIDLNTGLRYLNESVASESVNVSRYLIHKSITERKICKGVSQYRTILLNSWNKIYFIKKPKSYMKFKQVAKIQNV